MTSHNRQRRDTDPSKFTSKTPHFFKVILHETIRDGKLGIPRKFVKKHANRLPSTIQLEVPSGATWKVELTKCDEGVWLQKGWQEFAEHYSIKFGYFVVFRYEGDDGHFHVLIFDKSASEIEYPYSNTEYDCEDVSVSRTSKEKSDLPCPRPQKKIRTDSPDQPGTDLEVEILSSPFGADDPKAGGIKLGNIKKFEKSRCSTGQLDVTNDVGGIAAPRSVKTEVLSCMQKLSAAEKTRAVQRASAFKCTGNPVFMVVMQPSFVSYRYQMSIPMDFAREYLTLQNGNLTLCDSTGKTWPARYRVRSGNEKPRSFMHGGWRAFAEDNNLVVSDVCVFELIKHPEISFKVVIYPVVGNASRGSRECKDSKTTEQNEIIEVLDDFPLDQKTKEKFPAPCFQPCKRMRTNPSFTLVMQPSYVLSNLIVNIPYQFAKRYFEENGELTLRVSDGRTWMVEYKVCSIYKKVRFDYSSWKAFVLENNLKVRDTCVFELIKENGILLEVSIFPAAGCSSSKLGSTS